MAAGLHFALVMTLFGLLASLAALEAAAQGGRAACRASLMVLRRPPGLAAQ